jgi:hypothetical protein
VSARQGPAVKRAFAARLVLASALVAALGVAGAARGEGKLPEEDLDRMLAAVGTGSVDDRRAAAAAVCGLGPEAVEPIAHKLATLRRASDDGAASLVRGLHEPTSREAKEAGPDLLEWLLVQAPGPAQVRGLEVESMLRALAHAATTDATRQLVAAVPDMASAFRPEIGRLLRGLGDRAVPALIESRRDPRPEVRSWGIALLASIVKHAPGDALHVTDDRLLADVLRAYGRVSDMEALPEILALASSNRIQVRAAARESVMAYGQDAVWRLREAYAVLLGGAAPDGMPAADLAKALFDAYDRYRLRDVYDEVDRGVALESQGKASEAAAVFDDVLAREPLIERRREMVGAYADLAASRSATDPTAARAYLRKALRLDEGGPQSAHLRSELRRLEGEALVAQGIDDTSPFQEAVALEPGNRAARADLDRLRAMPAPNRNHDWRLYAAAAILAAAIAGVALLGRRP